MGWRAFPAGQGHIWQEQGNPGGPGWFGSVQAALETLSFTIRLSTGLCPLPATLPLKTLDWWRNEPQAIGPPSPPPLAWLCGHFTTQKVAEVAGWRLGCPSCEGVFLQFHHLTSPVSLGFPVDRKCKIHKRKDQCNLLFKLQMYECYGWSMSLLSKNLFNVSIYFSSEPFHSRYFYNMETWSDFLSEYSPISTRRGKNGHANIMFKSQWTMPCLH